MKKTLKIAILLIIIMATVSSLLSCDGIMGNETTEAPQTTGGVDASETGEIAAEGLWKDAIYRSDRTFGSGSKTVVVEVKVDGESVSFTIKTDKETLGAALFEHSLVEGDSGAYGLYIKKVNGITADYDADKSYWGFYKNGEYMMTGVDTTAISDGEHYELVREK